MLSCNALLTSTDRFMLQCVASRPCPADDMNTIYGDTWTRTALGRAHLPPTMVFRRLKTTRRCCDHVLYWVHKMSSKFMHAFLSNLANKQTDRHRGQSQLPPPLSEVKYTVVPWVCLPKGPMYFKLDTSKLVSSWTMASTSPRKINYP